GHPPRRQRRGEGPPGAGGLRRGGAGGGRRLHAGGGVDARGRDSHLAHRTARRRRHPRPPVGPRPSGAGASRRRQGTDRPAHGRPGRGPIGGCGPAGGMSVVGTAGHVDHGKSTLLLALTGRDPDRWEEEKRRGLTIDLGFVWATLPSGRQVSFVDVPGHERYIKNMLAGIEAIDVALLVVAADEGWMPQSEE